MSKPQHFYKFCSAKVAKTNLSTSRLRFSSPLSFNDPFDCYFPPGFSNLRRSVTSFEKRHNAILTGKEILPADSNAAFNVAPLIGLMDTVPPEVIDRARKTHRARVFAVADQFNRDSQTEWDSMARCFRLLSLCGECNNPLLWAHYANCHRGVAFEFDACYTGRIAEEISFAAAEPVRYRKHVPRAYSRKDFIESTLGLNPLPDSAQTWLPLMLTKSLEWSYEKEWRIMRVAGQGGRSLFTDLAFSPLSLSRIFLGCRISIRDRKAIERLATGNFGHVEIYQARQSQKRFALEFDPIR